MQRADNGAFLPAPHCETIVLHSRMQTLTGIYCSWTDLNTSVPIAHLWLLMPRRHCRNLGLTVFIWRQRCQDFRSEQLVAHFPAAFWAWLLPVATSLSCFTSFQGNWLRPLSMRPQFYPPALNGLIKQLTATWQTLRKQILPYIVFSAQCVC